MEIPVWAHVDREHHHAAVKIIVARIVTVAMILSWNVQLKLQVELIHR